jgi:hypothetical protein
MIPFTLFNQEYALVAYYTMADVINASLRRPREDPGIASMHQNRGINTEFFAQEGSVMTDDHNVGAVDQWWIWDNPPVVGVRPFVTDEGYNNAIIIRPPPDA